PLVGMEPNLPPRSGRDRRSGVDRRQRDVGPPPGVPERRKGERRRGERRRPGRVRRWVIRPIVWLLLLVIVLAAAALWYVYRPAVQRQMLLRLIPRIEAYIGRDVTVGSLRYSLFPLWIELRDVSVAGPQPGDPPILTVRRVYLQAELRSLRQQMLRLQEVQAEGVVVYVDRFLDGSDNWPRARKRAGPSKKPWELDITSFTVSDGMLRFRDRALPMELEARHMRVALLGMGGTDLQGRGVAESVTVKLPRANPYTAAVAAKIAVHRDGMEIVEARASSLEATVSGRGLVRWRGDKRVDLKLNGSVAADLFQRLGYIEDQVDGWFQVDGSVGWKPGVWGFRGQAKAARLRALDWELSGVEASIAGDRNAVWADIDRASYAGGGVTGWVEVTLPHHGGEPRRGQRTARAAGGDDVRRTRLQLRLEGIDAERFLDDSKIPVGDVASRLGGTLDYRFAETDWRHGQGVADMRVSADPRQGHGLALGGAVPLVIERGVVSTQAVRLLGDGQEIVGAARYELPTQRGTIDYRVESTDLAPIGQALPVPPAEDGGAPLWLPTQGSGELFGTLELQPQHTKSELHIALTDAIARGISADRAQGDLVLTGDALESMRLELAKGGGAALIAGRVVYGKRSPWNLDLDVAGWPIEDARPWLDFPLPVSGPFTGSVTLAGAGQSSHGNIAGEIAPGALFDQLSVDRVRARMDWDDERLRLEQLVVAAPAGEASLAGTMAFPGHQLQMTVAASSLDLGKQPLRDLLGGLQGAVSFAGTLEGTIEKPAVHG
ncbi:MAG TPA: hypothetical protein VN923_10085, partial [Thermoanaerobaculia bacterium]|nr:hypothetical protein [Thermoanaerobaculia bacterium]